MNKKHENAIIRKQLSVSGWVLLSYFSVMLTAYYLILLVSALLSGALSAVLPQEHTFAQILHEQALANDWAFPLAAAAGGLAVFLLKGPRRFLQRPRECARRMSIKTFGVMVCALLSTQLVSILFAPALSWIFRSIGLSGSAYGHALFTGTDGLFAFLYVVILAPLLEEMIVRGFVLRTFLPYGKRFAMVASSFLFSMLHADLTQAPYAFLAGLILAFIATEYGLRWSVLLHMNSNLFSGNFIEVLVHRFSAFPVELVLYLMIFLCAILVLVILGRNAEKIATYFSENKDHRSCFQQFFRSLGIVVFSLIMTGVMVFRILYQERGELSDNRGIREGASQATGDLQTDGRRYSENTGASQEAKSWDRQSRLVKNRIVGIVDSHIKAAKSKEEVFALVSFVANISKDELTTARRKNATQKVAEQIYTDAMTMPTILFEDKWSIMGNAIKLHNDILAATKTESNDGARKDIDSDGRQITEGQQDVEQCRNCIGKCR